MAGKVLQKLEIEQSEFAQAHIVFPEKVEIILPNKIYFVITMASLKSLHILKSMKERIDGRMQSMKEMKGKMKSVD